jgi:Uma2 family endonuclease
MTVDEWRKLERTSHDIKHEYIDGQVYAMSGGSLAHGRIGSNTVRTLEDALTTAGNPCDVYNSDVAVRLSPRRYTYPDASVTCDERDRSTPDKTDVQAPCVIVEVLSDSTEAYDRGENSACIAPVQPFKNMCSSPPSTRPSKCTAARRRDGQSINPTGQVMK